MSRPFYLSEFHQIDVPDSFAANRGNGAGDLHSEAVTRAAVTPVAVTPAVPIFKMHPGAGVRSFSGDGSGSLRTGDAGLSTALPSRYAALPSRNSSRQATGRPFHVLSAEPPRERQRATGAMPGRLRPANVIELPTGPLLTKKTPPAEAWKLACLVLAFLIWISTAGTLLFLYMDRYLLG